MCPAGLTHILRCSHFIFLFLFPRTVDEFIENTEINWDTVGLWNSRNTLVQQWCGVRHRAYTWDFLPTHLKLPLIPDLRSENASLKLIGEETKTQCWVWKIETVRQKAISIRKRSKKRLTLWIVFPLNSDWQTHLGSEAVHLLGLVLAKMTWWKKKKKTFFFFNSRHPRVHSVLATKHLQMWISKSLIWMDEKLWVKSSAPPISCARCIANKQSLMGDTAIRRRAPAALSL